MFALKKVDKSCRNWATVSSNIYGACVTGRSDFNVPWESDHYLSSSILTVSLIYVWSQKGNWRRTPSSSDRRPSPKTAGRSPLIVMKSRPIWFLELMCRWVQTRARVETGGDTPRHFKFSFKGEKLGTLVGGEGHVASPLSSLPHPQVFNPFEYVKPSVGG